MPTAAPRDAAPRVHYILWWKTGGTMRAFRMAVAGALFAGCIVFAVSSAPAGAASASDPSLKIVAAHIGDRSLTGSTRDHPVRIDPRVRATLSATVLNNGPDTVHVRYLRLSGALLGIHFVNLQASTNVDVAPGQTATISAPGDFFDIDSAATGYTNAKMQVVDDQRVTVASQSFVADIRGKLTSSLGLFFFQVLAFALISLVDIGIGVARRRLPRNRFVAGLLFAFAAASAVMTIVVGAAMLRVALFEAAAWIPALFLATAGAFFLGYVSPGRLARTAPEVADDRVIDLVAADAVARATGEQERRTTGEVASHSSGDHTGVAADVNVAATQHDSGGFTPHHDSGGFTPADHESGSHEPLA